MIKKIIEYLKEEQKDSKSEYDTILSVEEAYNNGNMEQVVNYFFEKFGHNFKAILDFCMQKSIVPDCSSEKEEQFIDIFSKRIQLPEQLASLDDMMLVRRCDFLPQNDTLEPSIANATRKMKGEIFLDGRIQEYEYDRSMGLNTIHFTINQEVKPHKDASEGWKDKKYTILQPMTEELYQSAISFEPMDTFFLGSVKLNNYIVICDSLGSAKELLSSNKNAIPLIVGDGKVPNFGNKIMKCMRITCPYVDYHGQWLDSRIPIESYYTDDFLKSHPKITYRLTATENSLHNCSSSITAISEIIEKTNKILQLVDKNSYFEEVMEILMKEENRSFFDQTLFEAHEETKNDMLFSLLLPNKYKDYGDFLNYLMYNADITIGEIDIQSLFEKMCEGLKIDENNSNQLKTIKEKVINLITDYNNNYREEKEKGFLITYKELGILSSKLLVLYQMMRTDAMNLPVKESEIYDVPIEWYDLSVIEEQKKEKFAQFLQSGKSWLDSGADLVNNTEYIKPEFPLQKPTSTTFSRAQELCKLNVDESSLSWGLIYQLKELVNSLSNGQHVSKNDIENINYIVSYVTLIENEMVQELNESNSKHR